MHDPSIPPSAVFGFNDLPPIGLHGIPRLPAVTAPGAVTITLGETSEGRTVDIAATSIEWLTDLRGVVDQAIAAGIVEAGMAVWP